MLGHVPDPRFSDVATFELGSYPEQRGQIPFNARYMGFIDESQPYMVLLVGVGPMLMVADGRYGRRPPP